MNRHHFDSKFFKEIIEEDKSLIKEWGPIFIIVVLGIALVDSLGKYSLPIILLGGGSFLVVYAWKESLEIQRRYLEEQRRELKEKLNELEREIRSQNKP